MDTGKLINNNAFYEGYEGEPEIVLTIQEVPAYSIHLWEGYFDDIFEPPIIDGKGWTGFTRDIQQMEGVFSSSGTSAHINASEYLDDLMSYDGKVFEYVESSDAFALIADFLRYAINNGYSVIVERD